MKNGVSRHLALGTLNRRQFTSGGLAAIAGAGATGTLPLAQAAAQEGRWTGATQAWQDLGQLTLEAQKLGLSAPRISLGASELGGEFDAIQPAVIDFMDEITASAQFAPHAASSDVDLMLDRASEILRKARNEERMPSDAEAIELLGAASWKPPKFEDIADDYRELFRTAKIRDKYRSNVSWYTSKVLDPTRRKNYERVFEETCVPWYFVGITHGMEAGFDLRSHLHNGDSLKKRTWQVPSGRPEIWNPPTDWVSSAVDAMDHDGFVNEREWDLAHMLYRWEKYNGWRSRVLHHINTPYLWSFSQHYTKGKFIRDNVWSSTAVSKQCGAAVILKALVEMGEVKIDT